jgi:hypothetical protein
LISLSLFVILVWSNIFTSWFVFLQVWLWSHLLFNTAHCWHQKWLSWWRFLFFLHILSMILFFVLNIHFLWFFFIHKF